MDLEFHKPEKDTDIRLQIRFSKVIASKSGWAYQLKTVLCFVLDPQTMFSRNLKVWRVLVRTRTDSRLTRLSTGIAFRRI